jgi:hypothetical protein
MNHIEFIEKHVRAELIKLGFTVSVAQGGIPGCGLVQAYEPGQQERAIFDDVLRFARLWAEKQTSTAERREAKRAVKKGSNQAGLF